MNGFDVRALGWVVTRDICSEMVRTALGGRRRMSPATLRDLLGRWRVFQSSLRVDRSWGLNLSAIVPLTTPLSKASETAIAEFVDQLTARCPDLYTEPALRTRYLNRCATFFASAAAGAVLGGLTPSDNSIIGDAALVLLVIACWSLITTIQLWHTHRLVGRIVQYHGRFSRPRSPRCFATSRFAIACAPAIRLPRFIRRSPGRGRYERVFFRRPDG
jgi:hypothetical protein